MIPSQPGSAGRGLAAGFGIGTATARRYVRENAHPLDQALRAAKRAGYALVVLDGTLIPIDRVAADRPYYCGKHQRR